MRECQATQERKFRAKKGEGRHSVSSFTRRQHRSYDATDVESWSESEGEKTVVQV